MPRLQMQIALRECQTNRKLDTRGARLRLLAVGAVEVIELLLMDLLSGYIARRERWVAAAAAWMMMMLVVTVVAEQQQ
jgi:hypothetical protein